MQLLKVMAMALEPSGTQQQQQNPNATTDWMEFCNRHALAAAQDFSKSCMQYITMNLTETARTTLTHKDFLRKFLDCFTEHFETDYNKRKTQNKIINGSRSEEEFIESEEGSPKMHHKPFFRR